MWSFIEKILGEFEGEFSRKEAYKWFVILIVGFMIRTDKLGVTSVVRDLMLMPESYKCILHFFRADSWDVSKLRICWYQVVKKYFPLYQRNGRLVLVGDGVKNSKEAHFMPGVKRMKQESETQSKPEYIYGHLWGGIGILLGDLKTLVCTPLSMRIHDGLQEAKDWEGSWISSASHVLQIIQNACEAAQIFGHCYCLLDRYFLSVPALLELQAQNDRNQYRMDLITKAKRSVVAYQDPMPKKPGQRGKQARRGTKVKLSELFQDLSLFTEATAIIKGKKQIVHYYSVDLLWGQKLYQKLRFVLVKCDDLSSILVSTDLNLDPVSIIELYSYRFRIEFTFRELKQNLGGFCYRFWTNSISRLNHYRKKTDPDPLSFAVLNRERNCVLKTIRAIEMHVLLSNIAMGILQGLSLQFSTPALRSMLRYQRTPAKQRPSEANIMYCIRTKISMFLVRHAQNEIPTLIRSEQMYPDPPISKKCS